MRQVNLPIFLFWCATSAFALIQGMDADRWIRVSVGLSGLYLFCIGAIMQFFPGLGARTTD
jgi:phosphatidylcholine synthase